MVDARRVDDAGCVFEPVAVEARGSLVQRLVVEHSRERAFVEVTADDGHRVDRRNRWHPEAAQGRNEAPSRGVLQRKVVDRCREDVGHLLRDQLLGGGHADVDRIGEAADRR